jgi:hypothetical protein
LEQKELLSLILNITSESDSTNLILFKDRYISLCKYHNIPLIHSLKFNKYTTNTFPINKNKRFYSTKITKLPSIYERQLTEAQVMNLFSEYRSNEQLPPAIPIVKNKDNTLLKDNAKSKLKNPDKISNLKKEKILNGIQSVTKCFKELKKNCVEVKYGTIDIIDYQWFLDLF